MRGHARASLLGRSNTQRSSSVQSLRMPVNLSLAAALRKAGFRRSGVSQVVIEATDPFGNRLSCTEDTWEGHVLPGHPEMDGLVEEAKQAITNPSKITKSGHSQTEMCYYRDAPSPYGGRIMKIVATVKPGRTRGYIKSAWIQTHDIPADEQEIWPAEGTQP